MQKMIIYTPPPDKSITIRAIILSALGNREITIKNPLISSDTIAAIKTIKKLGAEVKFKKGRLIIKGFGKYNAKKATINVGESALLLRLILPVVLNQRHIYKITGERTILRRSFKDTIIPLKKMGAHIKHSNYKLPLKTYPSSLKPLNFTVKSAQVKSSLLIASLYCGKIVINDILNTRDHTERLMRKFSIKIKKAQRKIYLESYNLKYPGTIEIPGDISQAAVFITIGILKSIPVLVKNCGINRKRTGFLKSLKKAGAKITFLNRKKLSLEDSADIMITPPDTIKPLIIKGISDQIDEIMLLSLILSKSKGVSRIYNVDLLKNKESNRINKIYSLLKTLGVDVKIKRNVLIIKGGKEFKKIKMFNSNSDHRLAMIGGVIKKTLNPSLKIIDKNCVKKTYPDFWKDLNLLF